MAEELRVCPNCGGKNLLQASRCVNCGLELEDFFRIEGQIESPSATLPIPGDEEGLPELLRDLQQPNLGGVFGGNPKSEDTKPIASTPEAKQEMPDWLSRVRERAKVEDPSGELIKKTSAADEVKEDPERVSKEFDAWIARLQETAQREAMIKAKTARPNETREDGVPDWLLRVRELQPKPEEKAIEEAPASKDETPQEAPKWDSGWSDEDLEKLRLGEYLEPERISASVEDEQLEEEPVEEGVELAVPETDEPDEGVQETLALTEEPVIEHAISDLDEEKPLSDTLVVPLENEKTLADDSKIAEAAEPIAEQDTSEKSSADKAQADLLLLKSQNERVEMLKALIAQEGKHTFTSRIKQPQRPNWSHLLLPLLMLLGILGALLLGDSAWPKVGASKAANVAFTDAIDQVKVGEAVLVVFDYQASTSAEIEIGVGEVLERLIDKSADLTLQTTQVSGLWLTDSLHQRPGLSNLPKVDFVPGSTLGMLIQTLEMPANPVITAAATTDKQGSGLLSYKRILLVSDSSASIRDWMEQINPWLPAGTLLVIAPHQESVGLSVYYDSAQIGGYLAGMSDFSVLSANQDSYEAPLASYRAYQVGLLIMIMLLLLGMVLKADQDVDSQPEPEVVK